MGDPATSATPRHRLSGWRRATLVGAGVLVVGGAVLVAPRLISDPFADDVAIGSFATDGHDAVTTYADGGFDALRYLHRRGASFAFPLVNDSSEPVEVVDVDPLPGEHRLLVADAVRVTDEDGLVVTLPFTLPAGARAVVEVSARFDNCQYTHERAIHSFDAALVATRVLGVTRVRTVDFERPIVVRTPTIVGCPGRKLARAHRTPPPTP